MEVKINREIRNYTESMFFGLSMRQFVFFCLGDPRRRGAVFSAETPLWDGNRQLDVHSRCRTVCGAGLYHLPRHDGRTIPLGVDALGAVRTERASL